MGREWGVPGESNQPKLPVMGQIVRKNGAKRGISCTLYDPRIDFDQDCFNRKVAIFSQKLRTEDYRIGYGHCIPNENNEYVDTKFGKFAFGSPLSYQLQSVEENYKFISNLPVCNQSSTEVGDVDLPLNFLSETDPWE